MIISFAKIGHSGMVEIISANPIYPVKEFQPNQVVVKGVLVESRRLWKWK